MSHPSVMDNKALDIHKTAEFTGTLNTSQQIDRMGSNEILSPCVTPQSGLFNMAENRPLTPADKFLLQGFPLHKLNLECLTQMDPRLQLHSGLSVEGKTT